MQEPQYKAKIIDYRFVINDQASTMSTGAARASKLKMPLLQK